MLPPQKRTVLTVLTVLSNLNRTISKALHIDSEYYNLLEIKQIAMYNEHILQDSNPQQLPEELPSYI